MVLSKMQGGQTNCHEASSTISQRAGHIQQRKRSQNDETKQLINGNSIIIIIIEAPERRKIHKKKLFNDTDATTAQQVPIQVKYAKIAELSSQKLQAPTLA